MFKIYNDEHNMSSFVVKNEQKMYCVERVCECVDGTEIKKWKCRNWSCKTVSARDCFTCMTCEKSQLIKKQYKVGLALSQV